MNFLKIYTQVIQLTKTPKFKVEAIMRTLKFLCTMLYSCIIILQHCDYTLESSLVARSFIDLHVSEQAGNVVYWRQSVNICRLQTKTSVKNCISLTMCKNVCIPDNVQKFV